MEREPVHRKTTRALVGFLSEFCQLRHSGDRKHIDRTPVNFKINNRQEVELSRPSCPGTQRKWPKVIMWLYVYLNLKMLLILYWQYRYDISLFNVEQIEGEMERMPILSVNDSGLPPCTTNTVACQLKAWSDHYRLDAESARETLRLFGNPYRERHWVMQTLIIIIMWISFANYMFPIRAAEMRLIYPVGIFLIRTILDQKSEMGECRQTVRAKVARLSESSKNYILNIVLDLERTTETILALNHSVGQRIKLAETSGLRSQLKFHRHAQEYLNGLVLSDQLIPINRSTDWVNRSSILFSLICFFTFIYALIMLPWLFSASSMNHEGFCIESPMDLVTLIELLGLCIILAIAGMNNCSFLVVTLTDQLRYIHWLVDRFRQCTIHNDQFYDDRGCLDPWNLRYTIQENVIKVLLEYEIFIAQFKASLRMASFVAISLVGLYAGVMVNIRAHAPYSKSAELSKTLYICISGLIICDAVLYPLCRISNLSRILHSRMTSLLCQLLDFDHFKHGEMGPVCDQHLVWQLRLILNDHDKFVGHFSSMLLPFVPLTSTNLIRIHCWLFLLVATCYFRIESWKKLMGDRFDDPLGLVDIQHLSEMVA